jgi:hypothetical protein
MIDTNNYFLLQAIISKPWTKLGNVGLAGLLACFYYRLIKFREAPKEEKSNRYYVIATFVKSHAIGSLLGLCATALILTNLMIAWPANCDPSGVSRSVN